MKLLIENWRKFLTEDESQHFPWMDELKANPRIFINSQLDKRNRIGSGAFRFTVSPEGDPDYVIKFSKFRDNHFMNKVEKLLGEEYPDVFPRTYAAAEDYEWIVADRVTPISVSNREMLEEAFVATMPKLYEFVVKLLSEQANFTEDNLEPFEVLRFITVAARPLNFEDNQTTSIFRQIQEFGLANEPWFRQLSKAMKRYGVDSGDIDEGNVGVDMKDHTLKVLDASVFSKFGGEKDWNS